MSNFPALYPGIEQLKRCASVEALHAAILSLIPCNVEQLKAEGLYIFGVGKLGQRVYHFLKAANIPVHGFVDNNPARQGTNFNGLLVAAPSGLPQNAIVYIASATYFKPIYAQLKTAGFQRLLSHLQAGILFHGAEGFPVEMYQNRLTEDLIENKERYLEVFSLLEDDGSKRVFDHLLQFRMSLDQRFIDAVHTHLNKEYFDAEVIQLGTDEVYFDVGGFDGDSAENFLRFVDGHYNSVHIFEPDTDLLEKARRRLNAFSRISYCPQGIYDKQTTLYFDVTGGLDGIISDQGKIRIDTTTIDAYSAATPTYIKFDVEGVELEAIRGAAQTIARHQPKLAIASYHYPNHLWEIPLYVRQINAGYRLRLRHYTDSVFDSIFYFI